jgi:hypothetical protein
MTALMWNLDREHARVDREFDRRTLLTIAGDSLNKIRENFRP